MPQVLGGIALLALWGWLQFGLAPANGYIHIALVAGALLIIHGIATSKWGTPTPR